jgi:hypothetical protein
MKNTQPYITKALALTLLLALSACSGGGSPEADAKKFVELNKRAQEVAAKASSGNPMAIAESMKLSADAAAFRLSLETKYKSDADKAKLAEAIGRATRN